MKRTLEIAIDMDGIQVDLLSIWLDRLNAKHGLDVCADDIHAWDLPACEKLKHLDRSDILSHLAEPNFYLDAKPIAGAVLTISALATYGHKVKVLTATPGAFGLDVDAYVQEQKLKWLATYLPFIERKDIIFASAKDKVNTVADVLIEDRPDTLRAYKLRHPHALVCGIEYPYNRHVRGEAGRPIFLAKDHNDTIRAWEAIFEVIEEFKHHA